MAFRTPRVRPSTTSTRSKPVTDLSMSVSAPAVVPHHLRHAITHALVRRKPVHLSVPLDVLKADIDAPLTSVPDVLVDARFVDEDAFATLVEQTSGPDAASNMVVLVGPGVLHAGATRALTSFAERFDIPVATTLSGKGAIPEDHRLALGVFGYGGSRWAIDAIRSDEVEILLVIGSGLSQRDTMQWDPRMLPSRALVHVERDPMLLGRTWPSDVPVVGDAGTVLTRLAHLDGDKAVGLEAGRATRQAFLERIRGSGPRVYGESDTHSDAVPMHPARVVSELRGAFPDDGVLCVDSGAHRAWFAEYWVVRVAGTHLSLTNLAPMGGAIPLGIGAKLARPDQPLMVATGDGCMLMHGMELHTAAREEVPMVIAVMNNRGIRQHLVPRAHARPRTGAPDGDPRRRLGRLRGSMGGDGEAVEHPDQIAGAVRRGLASRLPYLLDLRVDKTYPTPVGVWRDRQAEWEDHE